MPFEKIRLPNRVFNHYPPVGSGDCNGHISRLRPRSSGNLVLEFCFFLFVWYPPGTQTPVWHWDFVLGCFLNKILLSLYLSTFPSFILSWIFLTLFYPWSSWKTYLSQEWSPSLWKNTFLPSSDPLLHNLLVVPKELLYYYRDNPSPTPPIFSTAQLPTDHLIDMLYAWSHILLSDQHIFNHVHMRALARISLPAANPPWMISSCGFSEEVDLWTHA